ncbi:MAG: bifunctional hydroxymethylpyrimidine kinase/phosphomethylpyrimidine kinase [Myxococcota bacterium]|nr:bifunctional hydroxymethylpyrimidine kinase/phosphomethylpyrimidine kinase [Myxococcota bacterium]
MNGPDATSTPVLSIAGSDPSGGAGVQADLKTFAAHQTYGMAVITALTAQSTVGVTGVHAVPPSFVAEQIGTLLADIPPRAIKIGMLGQADVARAVGSALETCRSPIVLDPVMVSTSGHRLLDAAAEAEVCGPLARRAELVTPNRPEAAVLLDGLSPQAWVDRSGTALLLKGGHDTAAVVEDVLFVAGRSPRIWRHPRIRSRNTHGTGCTLSSAIAARLALGHPLEEAVGGAIPWLAGLIEASAAHGLGGGHGPLLHARGRPPE